MSAFNSGSVFSNFSGSISTLNITGNTPAVSTITGALTVAGGIGAGTAFFQSETVAGLIITGTVVAAGPTTGALVVAGGIGAPGAFFTSETVTNLVVTNAETAASLIVTTAASIANLQVSSSLHVAGTSAAIGPTSLYTASSNGPALQLSGISFNGLGSSTNGGISFLMNNNVPGNMQLGIVESQYATTHSTAGMFRILCQGTIVLLDVNRTDNVARYPLYINQTDLAPIIDNSNSCGQSGNRWSTVYGVNGSFSSVNTTSLSASSASITAVTAASLYVGADIRASLPNYYQWYATGNSSYQTISNGTLQVVAQFTGSNNNGSLYSALGGYSGITGTFFTGTHFVSANIRFAASAIGYRQVLFYQNVQLSGGTFNVVGGTVLAEAVIPAVTTAAVTTVALSAIVQLNSGDTISVVVAQSSGGNLVLDGSAQNNFSIFRIC